MVVSVEQTDGWGGMIESSAGTREKKVEMEELEKLEELEERWRRLELNICWRKRMIMVIMEKTLCWFCLSQVTAEAAIMAFCV